MTSTGSPVDERGAFLNDQVEFFERNVVVLGKQISNWMAAHSSGSLNMDGFGQAMLSMSAHEVYVDLANAFQTMADSTAKLNQETHEIMSERSKDKLLNMLVQIQNDAIDPVKKLLKDREGAIKLQSKLERENEEMSEKKTRMLSDQKRKVEHVNDLVDFHMQKLEEFRVRKLKIIMHEMSHIEMFYHCKALEAIPRGSKMISLIDPKAAAQALSQSIQEFN